jgi:thiol-disulfide isomerase/thioredoxin
MKIGFLRLLLFFIQIIFSASFVSAQNGYKTGDAVNNFPVNKILNLEKPAVNFNALQNELTIVDFFGTWCVPCIKALPQLTKIQENFKDKLSVILISNEDVFRLQKFLTARKEFAFPIVADTDNSITNLFQPPAYPYTIIIKDGKIIAITEAEKITEETINNWLKGETQPKEEIKTASTPKTNYNEVMNTNARSRNTLVRLSQDYMYAAKTGESTAAYEQQLKTVSYSDLVNQLKTDDEKKTFWINLYNGYVQATLSKNPEAYKSRSSFFKSKQLKIAGLQLSLDDIEHGILRRSKIKWSAGYLNKLFPGKTEKQLRVDQLDYRLHFALNCGAKSCPPIAFYNPENLSKQLDIAATTYLTGEAEYNKAANTVKLSAIMGWFRKDFGGKKGMIRLLKEKAIIPNDAKPTIKFKQYDWTLYLNNYQN